MNGKAKSNSTRAREVRELPVLPPVSKEGPVGFRKEKSGDLLSICFPDNSISSLAVQLYSFKFENVCVLNQEHVYSCTTVLVLD